MRKWSFMAACLSVQSCHFIWASEADGAKYTPSCSGSVQWVLMSEGTASVLVQLFFCEAQAMLEAKLRRKSSACLKPVKVLK